MTGCPEKDSRGLLLRQQLRPMKRNESISPFAYDLEEEAIRAERQKARDLRSSQWWKRRCAKAECHYCGSPTPSRELTMDHIVPLSRGGKSTKGNLVPACKICNTKKKQLLPMEWEAYLQNFTSSRESAGNLDHPA
jgi:5-methylcytosine-specific restriction enzyme A